jgi:hypothetical protein
MGKTKRIARLNQDYFNDSVYMQFKAGDVFQLYEDGSTPAIKRGNGLNNVGYVMVEAPENDSNYTAFSIPLDKVKIETLKEEEKNETQESPVDELPSDTEHQDEEPTQELSLKDKVEQRLRKAQENKAFKDSEGRIGGSAAEKAAYRMINLQDLNELEGKDEVTAKELVKKDRVFPKVDLVSERSRGVSSGAAYMKTQIREFFPNTIKNDPIYRKIYVAYADHISKSMYDIVSLKEIGDFTYKVINDFFDKMVESINPAFHEAIQQEKEKIQTDYDKSSKLVDEANNEMKRLEFENKEKYPELANEYGFVPDYKLPEHARVEAADARGKYYELVQKRAEFDIYSPTPSQNRC